MKCLRPIVAGCLLFAASVFVSGQGSGSPRIQSALAAQDPAHLLVLFPKGAERPSDAGLLKDLKKLPRTGWMLNVQRADGSLTGFVGRDALAAALAQTAPSRDFHAQLDAAVDELLRDPQNSAVLFASKVQPGFHPPEWADALVRKRVPMYVVDGGQWGKIARGDNGRSPGFMYDDVYLTTRKVRYITGGFLHEVSAAGAVKDIVKDRKKGYTFLYSQPN